MPVCVLSCFSHVRLFATLWTIAFQAPLSVGYWSGFLCPPPVLVDGFCTTSATWEVHCMPNIL